VFLWANSFVYGSWWTVVVSSCMVLDSKLWSIL